MELKNLKKGLKIHCIMLDGTKKNGIVEEVTDTHIFCEANAILIKQINYIRELRKIDKKATKEIAVATPTPKAKKKVVKKSIFKKKSKK